MTMRTTPESIGDEATVLALAVEKTKTILHDHCEALDRIAAVLFKWIKMTGDEIRESVGVGSEMNGGKAL